MRRSGAAWFVAGMLVVAGCGDADDGGDVSTTTSPEADASTTTEPEPAAPDGFEAAEVVAGDQHACALTDDGAAWCWGYNRFGQLGDGTNDDAAAPTAVAGGHRFARLAAGRYFTCGITEAGEAWCWGDNSRGQLGNGATGAGSADADRIEPVAVGGDLAFEHLVAGQLHVCGLVETGEAWCWGAYASGQLGNGAGEDQTAPTRSAEGRTFTALAPGGDTHTCGLDADGRAWCWGSNNFGQLGRGDTTNARQPEPAAVGGSLVLTDLVLGRQHTCGLDEEGRAWCWGGNDRGQLGDGSVEGRPDPTEVATELRFESLAAGDGHTCGVTDTGEAWCWGHNAFGQLGNGEDGGSQATPVAVAGDLTFASLSAGEEFTCGVTTAGAGPDGVVHCWGSNRVGWLGTGDDTPSPVPVPVTAA